MHDIKFIKKNPLVFDDSLKKRNLPPCSSKIVKIHNEYLEHLNLKQKLLEKKNSLSKSFANKKENVEDIRTLVHELKTKIDNLTDLAELKLNELNELMLFLPNILSKNVPSGESEKDNNIIKEHGDIKNFNFKPKNHLELAENLGLLDYKRAIKISGSRFSVLKSDLAKLHRGLINFLLDNNSLEFGFEEYVVPELVKSEALEGTGQLPKFEEDLFKTNFNDLYLIPTSEVPLTNLNRDSIIDKKHMPLKYTTYTNCFRAEAGASGIDTKGLMREHQFGKVELVTISEPDQSDAELNNMISCVENILKKLSIPYRIVELCSGDIGFSSSYTLDIEIWMPGQNKYREVSSCSNCTDFQSRRMKMRIKNFENGEIYYPHTLNGSSLAVGRLLISILENYQNEDGTIKIPPILKDYTNGLSIISNDKKI